MGLSPEQIAKLRAETDRAESWKPLVAGSGHPNPIIGEYVGDSTADTKFTKGVRIVILRDTDGKDWSVWLLGQLPIQWDEHEPKIEHGYAVSIWVAAEQKQSAASEFKYRPSKVAALPPEGSPSNGAATVDSAAGAGVESGGGDGEPDHYGQCDLYKDRLILLGKWPPSPAMVTWFNTHDAPQINQQLTRMEPA